jgi:hypothetical protein
MQSTFEIKRYEKAIDGYCYIRGSIPTWPIKIKKTATGAPKSLWL